MENKKLKLDFDLSVAAHELNINIAEKLMLQGADPKFQQAHGLPAMMAAINCASNDRAALNFVKMLVKHGDDIHFVNSKNENALFAACRACLFEVAAYLIEQGINQNHVNNEGKSAIDVVPGKLIIDMLSGKLDLNKELDIRKEKTLRRDMVNACQSGFHKKLDNLLKNSDDPVSMINSELLLHECCIFGSNKIKCADVLLKYPININMTNKLNDTALNLAIRHGSYDLATHLINKNADYSIKNDKGLAALDVAISRSDTVGRNQIIQLLTSFQEKKALIDCLNSGMIHDQSYTVMF